MNETHLPHLLIEEGPERGREIAIPEAGARIGRAHENDIVLDDPSLSRFQCRMFFRENQLCVMDLGSTNETLVNGKGVKEQPLHCGDEILIGEMTIRVVRENLITPPSRMAAPAAIETPSAPSSLPVVAPASDGIERIAPAQPEAGTLPRSLTESQIDLGLAGVPAPEKTARKKKGAGDKRKPLNPLVFWAIAALIIVAALAIAAQALKKPPTLPGGARASVADTVGIIYEKIEADDQNIFRYHLTLDDGFLAIQVDDLATGRKISKQKRVDPNVLESLASSLRQTDFMSLSATYEGVASSKDLRDLTLTLGRRSKRVKVVNRTEPDAFRKVRETLEEFGRNNLGLDALALSPEQLRERAQQAFLLGTKLFEERNNPKPDNLWNSIQAFEEVQWYLESVEPKPDFFEESIRNTAQGRQELNDRIEDYRFKASRHSRMNEWEEAARMLRLIMSSVPDRTDERYKFAERNLIEVERHLR
jgi:pSer/pThr/pTyr-binding forkhead associated (FHA) protein